MIITGTLGRREGEVIIAFQAMDSNAAFDTSTTGYSFVYRYDANSYASFTPVAHVYDSEANLHLVTLGAPVVPTPGEFDSLSIGITKTNVNITQVPLLTWDGETVFRGNPTSVSGTSLTVPGITLTDGMVVTVESGGGATTRRKIASDDTLESVITGLTTSSVIRVKLPNLAEATATVDTTGLATAASVSALQSGIDSILADYAQDSDLATLESNLSNLIGNVAGDVLTTQMTESYAANGSAPTITQALFLIQQLLSNFGISGTTMTARRLDGATPAATFTLNDSESPTSLARAS